MWNEIINKFLDGNKYINFLKHDLPILLENIPLQQCLDLIWQYDGAPTYNTLVIFIYMQEIYGNNWFESHNHHILICVFLTFLGVI